MFWFVQTVQIGLINTKFGLLFNYFLIVSPALLIVNCTANPINAPVIIAAIIRYGIYQKIPGVCVIKAATATCAVL